MKNMRLVIALLLVAPFAAFSASLEPGAAGGAAPERVVEDASGQSQCCWIFYMGHYFCVPC